MEKTCVLIPSYNEEKAIGGLIRELKKRSLTVYVVDDGSLDATASIAEKEGAVVVRHKVNKGKGASLREGFKHILKRGFETVLIMDGDGQHEPGDIDKFYRRMEETNAGMVIGNRMSDTRIMPPVRVHTNRFMSFLISVISGNDVPDTQCGFRLIKRSVLEKVNLKTSNFEIETELIVKTARAGFKIASVPVTTVYGDEKSKINPIIDTLRFMMLLVRLALGR